MQYLLYHVFRVLKKVVSRYSMMKEKLNADPSKVAPKKEPGVDNCWYMAGICALVLFLTSATIRSSGFLYIGIMDEFNVDRGQASWPICLMGAVSNMAGEKEVS